MAGTLQIDNIQTSAAGLMPVIKDSAGTEVMQGCTAWVLYNGATSTIIASFNISSVSRVSAGTYTISFASNMSNPNYALTLTATGADNGGNIIGGIRVAAAQGAPVNNTITSCDVRISISTSSTAYDELFSVAIFGGK